jgi:uncharacterized protein with HEPN domain
VSEAPNSFSWVTDRYGQRTRDVLVDITAFTDLAADLVARGKDTYDQDEMLRLAGEAIAHRIGEAVARLSDEFVAEHPDIEWRKIKGMRNIVAHEYARVDHEIVWNALADRMPDLAAYVRAVARR